MFHKTALLTLCSLFFLATAAPPAAPPHAAGPVTPPVPPPTKLCDTGSAQCCNSVSKASDPATATLTKLLGIVIQDVTLQVGLGCTPITVVGLGEGANCAQQPVCCTGNTNNAAVAVGCTPISL